MAAGWGDEIDASLPPKSALVGSLSHWRSRQEWVGHPRPRHEDPTSETSLWRTGEHVNRVSVLLVDDSAVFLDVAGQFLHERYAEEVNVVGTAGGGDQAIVQAEALRPHVIVLDLRMPGMTGPEVIPRLRALLPAVRIVMLTQLDGRGYREVALAAGADEFVSKASMDTDLLPAIRRVTRDLGRSGHAD